MVKVEKIRGNYFYKFEEIIESLFFWACIKFYYLDIWRIQQYIGLLRTCFRNLFNIARHSFPSISRQITCMESRKFSQSLHRIWLSYNIEFGFLHDRVANAVWLIVRTSLMC